MLSYRHSFHAGNFADVLKHIALVAILEHMVRKDKTFHYIDTHAGAGLFDLRSPSAQKLLEFRNGIGRMKADDWPQLERYFQVVRQFNDGPSLTRYPGSPSIALSLLRAQDRAWLYELHPADAQLLKKNLGTDRRVNVMQADGLASLAALLPPISKRALVFVDPSYEIKSDYQEVVKSLAHAHRKFPIGVYALWYPVIERARVERLERAFKATRIAKIQQFELCVAPDGGQPGMTGCGMLVINPPWTLMDTMSALLPRLADVLEQQRGGSHRATVLA